MKLHPSIRTRRPHGYVLLMVLVFVAISMAIMVSALNWSATNGTLIDRNNQYFSTIAAAEAATEKVIASLRRDFQSGGQSLVFANLPNYPALVPAAAENPTWGQYAFWSPTGGSNRTLVQMVGAPMVQPVASRYVGLYGLAATYRVVSNARRLNSLASIPVGVRQDIQLATIPLFQFAIFYGPDLEINPGPPMVVKGRVHGNKDLYIHPGSHLTFENHVTAVGDIHLEKHRDDPLVRAAPRDNVDFLAEHASGVGAIQLPVGPENSPAAVHEIIEIPPVGESHSSEMGRQRMYNKADLVIVVSNDVVIVTSGRADNFATIVPQSEWEGFLDVSHTFYNFREAKTIQSTDLDVGRLRRWTEHNTPLRELLGRAVRSVFIADVRTESGGMQNGVRVVNGEELPELGLTVATPNPLYVQGDYNVDSSGRGTHDTRDTKPAALMGDALFIQSRAWQDDNSFGDLGRRRAEETTINAAFLAGIVPTRDGYYSGGVENFPRFMEDWSGGVRFTYNGSMVALFDSETATAPWGSSQVYVPPNRSWAFDSNFLDPTKLPPGTPEARLLIRAAWAALKAGVAY